MSDSVKLPRSASSLSNVGVESDDSGPKQAVGKTQQKDDKNQARYAPQIESVISPATLTEGKKSSSFRSATVSDLAHSTISISDTKGMPRAHPGSRSFSLDMEFPLRRRGSVDMLNVRPTASLSSQTLDNPGVKLTDNSKSELNLKKFMAPPVRELQPLQAILAIKALKSAVLKECKPVAVPAKNEDAPLLDEEQWNQRIESTNKILNRLIDKRKSLDDSSGAKEVVLAYYVADKPIGVMAITRKTPPLIVDLVTHPLSERAGGTLIESAVRLSRENGGNGVIRLADFDAASRKAYEAMGFRSTGDTFMELDPNPLTNDKWCEKDGELRLKKYADKKYLG